MLASFGGCRIYDGSSHRYYKHVDEVMTQPAEWIKEAAAARLRRAGLHPEAEEQPDYKFKVRERPHRRCDLHRRRARHSRRGEVVQRVEPRLSRGANGVMAKCLSSLRGQARRACRHLLTSSPAAIAGRRCGRRAVTPRHPAARRTCRHVRCTYGIPGLPLSSPSSRFTRRRRRSARRRTRLIESASAPSHGRGADDGGERRHHLRLRRRRRRSATSSATRQRPAVAHKITSHEGSTAQ